MLIAVATGRSPQWPLAFCVAFAVALLLAGLGEMLEPLTSPADGLRATEAVARSSDPQVRLNIVRHWQASPAMQGLAETMLLVDTLIFIPAYALALTAARGAWRRTGPRWLAWVSRWRVWKWLLLIAVAADAAENVLTAVFVRGLAPAVGVGESGTAWDLALWAMSHLKWIAVCILVAILLAEGFSRLLRGGRAAIFGLLRRLLECFRDAGRYLWRYAVPLAMASAGVAMLYTVPQSREIVLGLAATSTGVPKPLGFASVALICWAVAVMGAFALLDSLPSDGLRERAADDTSALRRGHQLLIGFVILLSSTLILSRIAQQPNAGLVLFIVTGSIFIWLACTWACTATARTFSLPTHPQARPLRGRMVAWLYLGLVATLLCSLFLPTPDEDALRGWGFYRKPDMVWRWRAQFVDSPAALHTAAALSLMLLAAGRLNWRRSTLSARTRWITGCLFASALLAWILIAWRTLGPAALIVQLGVVGAPAIVLWTIVHRAPSERYSAWRRGIHEVVLEPLTKWPRLARKVVRLGINTLIDWITTRPVRVVAALTVFYLILPFVGDTAASVEVGTLAVVFSAIALWGLLVTVVFVYLPLRHGLGNWVLVPFLWAAVAAPGARWNPALRAQDPQAIQAAPLPTLHTHFANWRQGLPDAEGSPVFLVAAAGGGLRAAYWSAMLLAELDDRTCGQFGRHVLAASGVSGGSIGIAMYASQRRIWEAKPQAERCGTGRSTEMRRILGNDFLAPVAASLLFADGVQAMVPYRYLKSDRGDTLAEALKVRWAQQFQDTHAASLVRLPLRNALSALSAAPGSDANGMHPLVFFNATAVETGRRVVGSNVDLGTIPADSMIFMQSSDRLLTADISVIDAAMNSARFPGISPVGALWRCPSNGSRKASASCEEDHGIWVHLIDGGYFENSGLETLNDAVQALRQPGILSIHKTLPPMFVIAISNDAATSRLCAGEPTPRLPVIGGDPKYEALIAAANLGSAGLTGYAGAPNGGLSAIGSALLSVREGRARLELERTIRQYGCPRVLEWSLASELHRADDEPALGWLLSAKSLDRMDAAVKRYADAFPFDLASCPGRFPPPRGVIGDAGAPHGTCPQPLEARVPLRTSSKGADYLGREEVVTRPGVRP